MIVAGVVTYEPDAERLQQNLSAIAPQVHKVAVYDNGSSNREHIGQIVQAFDNVVLIRSPANEGIAKALNRLADWARHEDAGWIVTLDQDSVCAEGMVAELVAVSNDERVALVTPYIVDRNKMSVPDYLSLQLPRSDRYIQAARRGAITSGALTNLVALSEVGGWDEKFFIDYVDYDLNQRLLFANYRILRANQTFLLHEVGKASRTWLRIPRKDMDGSFRVETFYSFGHSEQRCYFKARNRILFTRKYGKRLGVTHEGVWQLPQQMALTVLFETDRRKKLFSFLRGVRDGLKQQL